MTSLRPISFLKPHEEISLVHALRLLSHVARCGRLPAPILIDQKTGVILDGHHRHWVCLALGLATAPCTCVDYFGPQITVRSRRPQINITKEKVIAMALRGETFPYKTTRHTLCTV